MLERNWDSLNESVFSASEEIIREVPAARRRKFTKALAHARESWANRHRRAALPERPGTVLVSGRIFRRRARFECILAVGCSVIAR